jgi:ribosome-associated translation inhibitor RaiA
MNITTRAQDFEMSEAIDKFARNEADTALQRFSEYVVAVDVFMKDANGPKGGIDKQVLIHVRLRNRQTVTVETAHDNLYAAIKIGTKRTKRAVRRHLRKSGRIQKRRMRNRLNATEMAAVT